MGTRSVIGVMHGNKAKTVYCHFDGYVSHNGKILLENYNSAKANHLVALGDMSSLRPEIEIPEGQTHSFDNPLKGVTVFYGRDRGETDVDFKVCQSDQEMFDYYSDCEYFYIIKDGVWYGSEGAEWKVLRDAIAEDAAGEAESVDLKLPAVTRLIGMEQEA
jgi:hypothetical protein